MDKDLGKKIFGREIAFKDTNNIFSALILGYILVFLIFNVSGNYIVEQDGTTWELTGYTGPDSGDEWYPGALDDREYFYNVMYREGIRYDNLVFFSAASNDRYAELEVDYPPGSEVTLSDDTGDLSLSSSPEGDWSWSDGETAGGVLELNPMWSEITVNPDTSEGVGPELVFIDTSGNRITLDTSEPFTVFRTSPYPPIEPEPEDGYITESESVSLSALYDDPQDDSGSLTFYDASDDSPIGGCNLVSGERCENIDWDINHGENYWYGVSEDEEGRETMGRTWYVVKNQPPSEPEPQEPEDGEKVEGDEIDLEAEVEDPDGDTMDVEFVITDVSDGSEEILTDENVQSGSTASVTFEPDRGTEYEWYAEASDSWESTESEPLTFTTNSLPTVSNPNPEDEGVSGDSDTELSVFVEEDDGNDVTVYFFDASSDELIGSDEVQGGEGEASTSWSTGNIGDQYEWYVKADDGLENFTSSDFLFTRVTSEAFRPRTNIDYRYTGLVMSQDQTASLFYEIENQLDDGDAKNINITLSGVNARFIENGEYTTEVVVEGGETERLQIIVDPENSGANQELVVTSRDTDSGLTNQDRIPVYVREIPGVSTTREVTGIGAIQMITIGAVSTLLLYYSLL